MSPRPVEGVTEEQRERLRAACALYERGYHGTPTPGEVSAIRALLSEVEWLRAERERYEKALREIVAEAKELEYFEENHAVAFKIAQLALSASAPEPKP